jgi:hypothetical protein
MPTRFQKQSDSDVVYIIYFAKRGIIKIGTTSNFKRRIKNQERTCGAADVLAVFHGSIDEERALQNYFSRYAVPSQDSWRKTERFVDNDEIRDVAKLLDDEPLHVGLVKWLKNASGYGESRKLRESLHSSTTTRPAPIEEKAS